MPSNHGRPRLRGDVQRGIQPNIRESMGQGSNPSLGSKVMERGMVWNTPRAQESPQSPENYEKKLKVVQEAGRDMGMTLSTQVGIELTKGLPGLQDPKITPPGQESSPTSPPSLQLSPRFVEWLQGVEMDWSLARPRHNGGPNA